MNHPENDYDPDAFQRWLAQWPKGLLGIELSEEMARCVKATRQHDKKSTLALKIEISPRSSVDGELEITADVAAKPAKAKPVVTYFADDNGGLRRDNPNQPSFPGTENIR